MLGSGVHESGHRDGSIPTSSAHDSHFPSIFSNFPPTPRDPGAVLRRGVVSSLRKPLPGTRSW